MREALEDCPDNAAPGKDEAARRRRISRGEAMMVNSFARARPTLSSGFTILERDRLLVHFHENSRSSLKGAERSIQPE